MQTQRLLGANRHVSKNLKVPHTNAFGAYVIVLLTIGTHPNIPKYLIIFTKCILMQVLSQHVQLQ